MEDPVEGNFLGLNLAQGVGVVPNDNDGYNFGFGLVLEDNVVFEGSVIVPNAEDEQGAVALNQLSAVESELNTVIKTNKEESDASFDEAEAQRDAISEELDTQKAKQEADKAAATTDRERIQSELDTQEAKQESERAAMDAAYKAADSALEDTIKANKEAQDTKNDELDAKDSSFTERLDVLEANDTVEGSIDWHIAQVIDAAPAALDTLNELAASLGDDADFAGTITDLIATHRSELEAADANIQSALDTQEAKQESDKAAATTDRERIQSELDAQEDKQESEKVAADEDRALIREELSDEVSDLQSDINDNVSDLQATIKANKEASEAKDIELEESIKSNKEESDAKNDELDAKDAELQESIDSLQDELSQQISEIENEGVQDTDFDKVTANVGGKSAGATGEVVIPGKVTNKMFVCFVGGLFQHGATASFSEDTNTTTISVVLYSDQPEYSPMTVLSVKSF